MNNWYFEQASHLAHGDPNKTITGPDGTPQPDTGYFGLKGRAALDARPGFEKQLDDLQKQARGNLTTPEQQLEFDSVSRRYRTNLTEKVGTHADQQANVWYGEVNRSSAKLALDQIAINASDPKMVAAGAADLRAARVKDAQLRGGGPELLRDAIAGADRDAAKTLIEATAQTDPSKARRMVESYRTQLGADYPVVAGKVRAQSDQADGIAWANEKAGLTHNGETTGFFRDRSAARIEGTSPVFANRLRTAIEAAEAATGERGKIESLKRTTEEQARLFQRYQSGQGGLAAPPGQSRHEFGEAADIHDGKVLDWLHQHAGEYGLEFLKGKNFENDSGHIQLARGVSGGVGGTSPLPPKGDVMMQILSDPQMQARPQMQASALAQANRIYEAQHTATVTDLASFKQRVQDSTQEALHTGSVQTPIPEEEFIDRRGAVQGAADYRSYIGDVQYGAAAKALETMPYAEQVKLLDQSAPVPGEGYADQLERNDRLTKTVRDIDARRRDDPAGAVDSSPAVRSAYANYQPNNPETFKPVAAARLAAQEALGIDPEYRSPITKQEALKLTAPLRAALPGNEKETLTTIADHFQKMFGDEAPQAFAFAIRAHKVDAETAQVAARVMRKLSLGQAIQPEEAGEVDAAKETAAADRAVTGAGYTGREPTPLPFVGGYLNPAHEAEGPEVARVPPRAIEYLLAHPESGTAFDQQFAQAGLAKRLLEKYGAAAGGNP